MTFCGDPPATHVIFDLDGVLLDTEKLYTEASDRLLARFGQRLTPSLKRRVMAREPLYGAQLVVDELRLPMDGATFLRERDEPLAALLRAAEPMPGARELVAALARRAVPMAVATSSDRALFRLKTEHHAWFAEFTAVVCADDVPRPKPAPDLFLAAAERMGASPKVCLVFEDSPAGIEAAKRANMRVVGLADARTGREAVRGADVVIESFAGLSPWAHLVRA